MTIIFKGYKNLKINEIEGLLINLCPTYMVPGLKLHNKTQKSVRTEMFYQRNQGHRWRWGRNLFEPWFSRKLTNGPWRKIKYG